MALKDRHPLREGEPDPDYTRALHAAVDEIAYAFDFDAAIPLPLERQEFVIDSVRELTRDLDRRYAARQPLEMSVTITLPDGTEIEHDGHPR